MAFEIPNWRAEDPLIEYRPEECKNARHARQAAVDFGRGAVAQLTEPGDTPGACVS